MDWTSKRNIIDDNEYEEKEDEENINEDLFHDNFPSTSIPAEKRIKSSFDAPPEKGTDTKKTTGKRTILGIRNIEVI